MSINLPRELSYFIANLTFDYVTQQVCKISKSKSVSFFFAKQNT